MLCMRRSFLFSKQFAPSGESVIPVSHYTIPAVQADSEPADTELSGDFSQADRLPDKLVPSPAEVPGM